MFLRFGVVAAVLLNTALKVSGQDSSSVAIAEAVVGTAFCPSECNDSPPPVGPNGVQFSCEEQKEFGKCDADFMLGFCECTCERCCPCNNFPPPGKEFTCQQQKEFGKCDVEFMDGFCECECGRCPAMMGEPEITPSSSSPQSSQEVSPPEESEEVCPAGFFEVFGSSPVVCETLRCAENRQSCGNRCGGLSVIDFDCQDSGSSFSSSCACAGK